MNLETISRFLLYSTLLNYGLVTIWFLTFYYAHDWLHRMHNHWFPMPKEPFDIIHYSGMALYKIGIMLFNLVPYIALCLMK